MDENGDAEGSYSLRVTRKVIPVARHSRDVLLSETQKESHLIGEGPQHSEEAVINEGLEEERNSPYLEGLDFYWHTVANISFEARNHSLPVSEETLPNPLVPKFYFLLLLEI